MLLQFLGLLVAHFRSFGWRGTLDAVPSDICELGMGALFFAVVI
jgi:hypothetical protein